MPLNQITHVFFRDQDGATGSLGGTVMIEAAEVIDTDPARVESIWVYWADEHGNKDGNVWFKTSPDSVYQIELKIGTPIPDNVSGFLLYPSNKEGLASEGSLINFHDFVGNAELAGPGGNELDAWYYGDGRPTITVQRTSYQGGLCIFDNGLVSVTDMNNTEDENWKVTRGNGRSNLVNEIDFPAYEFLCDENPVNTTREISDDIGVWTYSTINDAMFYGTVVYDSFLKYLGEPPLEEKIRLRVHYGHQSETKVYWDGAYANFSDGYPFQYSMASLDSIAHEIGHGVLNRISPLNAFEKEISTDARTLHEAFSDLSGVMAKYEFTGDSNNWVHGEESMGEVRRLNQINTEIGAIGSLLDYEDAGENFYLRIGMVTYPFYLLSNQWGLEQTYKVYLNSAKACWTAMTTLTEAAECIKQQAVVSGFSEADVVDAFKTVKIKLFEEGVLSHFKADTYKLRVEFSDNSQSTSRVSQWLWDFGDGHTSTEQNPEHIFAESGDYHVSLMVTDQSNDQDSFYRLMSVNDQYCTIKDTYNVDNHISRVMVDGMDINFSSEKSDYTESTINLMNPENTVINIEGESTATERSTTWRAWVDLNDNGVFGDEDNELIVNTFVAEGLPYALNTVLDLSDLPNDGEPKYMRIIGDYAAITPCSTGVGEALDLRITW